MDIIELSPAWPLSVDPSMVASVIALPSDKALFGKTKPEIVVSMKNGKEYHLSVTQKDLDVNKLYYDIVKKLNEARKGDA